MKKPKILVIEDEEGIREGLNYILAESFEVEFAENGIDGLKKAIRNHPDLILLDLKMPEMDGFQTTKAIRQDKEFDHVPILVLSAFNNVTDRTRLFEMGADDYMVKPFDRAELLARIQRKLQTSEPRAVTSQASGMLTHGQLELDVRKQEVHIGSDVISLSTIEFKLLHLLMTHYNQLVSRENILEWVWEKQAVSPRLIDPHILSLRNKLNNHDYTIQSVYGKGYILKNL